MSESLSKKVARNTIYSALGYLVSIVILFFLIPYVIAALGPKIYGIWVIISVLTGYFGLSDLGIGLSFQKYIAEYYAHRDTETINKIVSSGFAFYSLLGIVLMGLAFVFVDPLFSLLNIPLAVVHEARIAFLIAVMNLGLGNPLSVFASVLNGMQLIDVAKKIETGISVFRVALYVTVLGYGLGIIGLVVSETCLLLLSAAVNRFFLLRVFPELRLEPWRLDTVIFRKLFAYGSKLQISRVADSVNFQFDRIIVSKFVGIDYVMFADVGGRLLSRIRVLPLILLSSLIPAVSELQAMNQTERIRLAFDRSTKFLAFISVPLFVFAAAFAHPIVRIWLGSSFSIAAYTMQILALGYLFNVLTGSISFFSQGIGNLGAQMWTSIIQAATNIVLSIVLVFRIGYYGVMIGTLISLIVGAVLFVFAFNKILKGSLRSIVHILKLPLVASTISVFIAMIPSFFEGSSIHGKSVEALLLTVSGFVFISMYFVILRIGEYFDEWDAEFLLRISPKFSFFAQLILSKERGTRLIESQKRR